MDQDTETNARTGLFSFYKSSYKVECKTPHCLLVTCRGSLPHVTNDLLSELPSLCLELDTCDFLYFNSNSKLKGSQVLKEFGSGIQEYCQLQPHPLYLSFISQQELEKVTYSAKRQQLKCYQRGSCITFSESEYLDLVHTADCHMAECPCVTSYDDCSSDSSRTIRDYSEQSTVLQSNFIKQWSHHSSFDHSIAIGVVQGGMDIEQRKQHAKTISQLTGIGGFYIDALQSRIKLVEQQRLAHISISQLPTSSPRVMNGSTSLEQVIGLVACGIDCFISSYPYTLSIHGYALDLPHKNNLWNIQYRKDKNPLSLHCSCPVCRQYSRAYLNHLLNVHEMLAMTLLMVHNTTQYMEFFHQLQRAIETKTFLSFQKQFLANRRVNYS
ncbi:queuine tR-ribosyltransferase, putative isoform 1 [Galdieria sulphuraria]|uniref:Queuine tR-ribosyltransferase, putative isoform 1 n=1 Tax=Galdieria sulphuraria TaxID=130081 RepID=M2Y6M6_GALSU|nr:queuine tR-ribosyltransferase, putative isoform 1 [Galdieria sulphuraria]EME31509.1 queuine tR-ribosyltransferase, putative isoform 1 [Galdieria sulphuraria]|eukprot:XP_005708029.1 queuine tR-ribosyltransferase, putative isoform 1 [Galdieria sulphuraria]